MRRTSRRDFLGQAGMGVAAGVYASAGASRLHADPLGLPIGFQIFGVTNMAVKDLGGTFRQIGAIGYRTVELVSFPGFQQYGYDAYMKMKGSEVRKLAESEGIRCESCYVTFLEWMSNREERIAYGKELGLNYMVCSGPHPEKRNGTLDDWKQAADQFNKFGADVTKAGMMFAFHNHNWEFAKPDGVLVYDMLLERTDPKLVGMQIDLGGMVGAGYDPVDYFAKYPGRFHSLHLKDVSKNRQDQGGRGGGGSVAVGKGDIDWKRLYAAAKAGGVKNHFVEMEVRPPTDPLEALKVSYAYLHALNV